MTEQKMLFHHNNYKGIGPVPKKSELLMDILYGKSDDSIVRIKNKIEGFSKYKKPGTKRTLTHVQYVYRTLTNEESFKSIISTLTKTETRFITFLCDRKGEVGWKEVKSAGFTEKLARNLCLSGLVFVFPDLENPEYVILPVEYRYLLSSDNRDKDSVLYALRNLGTEKVKQITNYLNERFRSNYDPSLSKASNVAFLYHFLTTRGDEIERTLTVKQQEILSFVLRRGNEIDLEDLLNSSPALDVHAWEMSINNIFKNYFHRFQSGLQDREYTELQELFHRGVLVFRNPDYGSNVFIPREIFPVLAREYLVNIEAKKQKIMVEMVSGIPGDMKGKSVDSLLHMLTKKIVTFLVFSYIKPTQKGLIPKTAIKKCARVLKIDPVEHIDCLSIFILLKDYVTVKGKKCFVLTQKGEQFLSDNLPVMDFWSEMEDFFLITTDWNELYKSQNRVPDYYAIPLNCEFKGLLYKRVRDIPHQWLKAAKFREILYADYGFAKIRTMYDSLEHIREGHYHALHKSEFNDLNGIYASVLQTMYFLGLLDIVESEKGISHIKLSRTAIVLVTNQTMDAEQKSVHTQKKIILQPNGEIVCMPGTPHDILSELGRFAELKEIDRTIVFELTSQQLIRGIAEFKLDVTKIMKFLTDHTGKELPQNIAYLFKQLKAKEDLLTVGRCGGYIKIKDHILLEEIKNIKSMKKYIGDSGELPVLFLRSGSDIREVLRELRKKGYLPKEAEDMGMEIKPLLRHRYEDYEDDDYF